MSAVPMAIFYADKLDDIPNDGNLLLIANAADELRRLSESNRCLIAALNEIASGTYDTWTEGYRAQQIAIAAIAKASGATS